MDWIEELKIQRHTKFSPLIIVETDDQQRIWQFIKQRPSFLNSRNGDIEKWYILDSWDGLYEIKPSGDIRVIESCKEWGEITPSILSKASDQFQREPVVLIVKNILKFNDVINTALFNWATNRNVWKFEPTVVLFVDSIAELPRQIWSNAKVIKVPRSTREERRQVLQREIENFTVDNKEDAINAAVSLLAGLNLDQIDAALAEAYIRNLGRFNLESLAKIKRDMLMKDPVVSLLESKYGFEAVGGYKKLKKLLLEEFILPMKFPDYAKKYGIDPPRGIILFGPPGTGKSLLVKCMGKELNRTVLKVNPENVYSKWVGESEKRMRKVFDIADAMKQVIIFIDEFDRYGKRGGSSGSGGAEVRKEIFSMLLEELGKEEREWFFVAATNRIEDIDSAMLRTGRIDAIVPMPFPDLDARIEILKIHSQLKRNLPLEKNIDYKKLAEDTLLWSGSDLEQLVIRTAREVMKRAIIQGNGKSGKIMNITTNDFLKELKTFKINFEENKAMHDHIKDMAQRYTNDKKLLDIFEETTGNIDRTSSRLSRIKMGE